MNRWLGQLALWLFAVSVLAPIVWVVLTSLKSGEEIFRSPWALPASPRWENYANAWSQAGIGTTFLNSVLVTLGTLLLLIPISAMAAYVLAKYVFPGRNVIFGGFLGGMMFPNFLVIVPLFLLTKQLGLFDTKTGLILVYVAYSLAFSIFVLTGYFQVLPDDLRESAMLDGCGHTRTFWHVMLPLAKPGLLVVILFNAIGLWNEYGLALVLMVSPQNRTLPLGIAELTMTQHYQADWGALFAGLVIVLVPVVLVYTLFRKHIYETMLSGAIKQ